MHRQELLRVFEAAPILLFLLQTLRVLLSVLFGLVYDVVFAAEVAFATMGLVVLFVMLSFSMPLLIPIRQPRGLLLVTAFIAALARVPLTINHPTIRLWASLLILAAAGTYASTLLHQRPRVFVAALMLGSAADQFLRAAGNTYDVSLRPWWIPSQIGFSLMTCAVAWFAFFHTQPPDESLPEGGIDILSGLALGALLFLETSLLGFPNALARWTGANYAIVAPLLMAATLLPVFHSGTWGGFAILSLTLLIGWGTGHRLHQLAVLIPMLLAQHSFLSASRTLAKPTSSSRPRLSWVLGMWLFLLLNVALAFAFTYPYTVSFFRDKGDYVYLFAILVLLVPAAATRPSEHRFLDRKQRNLGWTAAGLIVVLTVVFSLPHDVEARERRTDTFRVGTYNIHYGYDSDWTFSLEQQARTIERSDADIVMLQEVDAGRITSYGVDDALWLGRRLGMAHAFGPALESLSGVALLSRFPITEAESKRLTSQLEQTAIVHARMPVGNRTPRKEGPLDGYAIWLGLEPEERARQLDDALAYVGDAAPALLGGDFNATPGSPTYEAIESAGFKDPFLVAGVGPAATSPAIDPSERIDFVWARGLNVIDAQVLDSLASDHRMVIVELALP